jgi:tetratricopeptide (TPR) repeat protein
VHLEAFNKVEPTGLQPFIEMIATELCTDYALQGAWEEARAYAQKVLSARSDVFLFSTQLTLWYRTEALVRADEIERAHEDVEHFGTLIGHSRRYRIPYLRALAVLAESRGDIAQAIAHLKQAAMLSEAIGLPGELWSIQAALGELYLLQGQTDQAHAAFKRAGAIAQKLADALASDEQRANFLSSSPVRRVLGN